MKALHTLSPLVSTPANSEGSFLFLGSLGGRVTGLADIFVVTPPYVIADLFPLLTSASFTPLGGVHPQCIVQETCSVRISVGS